MGSRSGKASAGIGEHVLERQFEHIILSARATSYSDWSIDIVVFGRLFRFWRTGSG